MIERLSRYNVKYRKQDLDLDYSKREAISRQRIRRGRISEAMAKRNEKLAKQGR